MVLGLTEGKIFPLLNDLQASSALTGSQPITVIRGLIDFASSELPDNSQPPPTGTNNASSAGSSSSNSLAAVP
jgi:hypothetical protein